MVHTLTAAPVQDRAVILDALRGFALLGVLLDNLFAFTGWAFLTQEQQQGLATWPADGILGMIELALVHGKFYSLFSLLFGVGFSVILLRNEQRGNNPLKIFYRRLLILALMGLAHIFLLWEGDILLLYAAAGLLLPLFRKSRNRTILVSALVFLLAPLLIDAIRVLFQFSPGDWLMQKGAAIDAANGIGNPPPVRNYLFGKEDAWQRWRQWLEPGFFYRYSDLLNDNRFFKVFGMFLLGFYAGRKVLYVHLAEHVTLFKSLRKWGLIVGLPAAFVTAYLYLDDKRVPHLLGLLETVTYAASVVPLALAYASQFCLRWVRRGGNTRLRILAPLGRMALTNYIMQTILGIVIYYGVGLNLGGYIGPSLFFIAGLAVYVVQIMYSTWWLKHFNYGPLEWVWRMLTYGKRLPLRKKLDKSV